MTATWARAKEISQLAALYLDVINGAKRERNKLLATFKDYATSNRFRTLLHFVVRCGLVRYVAENRDVLLRWRDEEGRTILHLAVTDFGTGVGAAPVATVQELLEVLGVAPLEGASGVLPVGVEHRGAGERSGRARSDSTLLDEVDRTGNSALHICCAKDDAETLLLLLRSGASATIVNAVGEEVSALCLVLSTLSSSHHPLSPQPLHIAMECGALKCVRELVRCGVGDQGGFIASRELLRSSSKWWISHRGPRTVVGNAKIGSSE